MRRLFCVCVLLWLLTGCGDARETSLLSPVSAAALSKTDDGVQLTAETVWQDSAEGLATPQYLSAKARTVERAFEKVASSVGGEFYFSHAQVFVVSEQLAREGLLPLAKFFVLDEEVRLGLRIAVARDASAEAILRAWAPSGEVPGFALGRMLAEGEKRGTGVDMPLFRFYDVLSSGADAYLPAVTVGVDGQAIPDGMAHFAGGRLIDFVGGEDDAG